MNGNRIDTRLRRSAAALATFTLAVFTVVGCGGSSDSGQSYQGPGSHWDVSLASNGAFSVLISDAPGAPIDTTVAGSYQRLASGFVHMVVGEASGQGAPSPGDSAIALEVPGFALLLKPLDANGELIPMIRSGQCPSTDFDANWFLTRCDESGVPCDATDDSKDWLGSFSYDATTRMASLPAAFALDGSTIATNPIGGAACSEGVMELSDARMYLTAAGGAIVETNLSDPDERSHILAIPSQTVAPAALAGSYAAFVFDGDDDTVMPMSIEIAAGGASGTVFEVTEQQILAGQVGSPVATIAFSSVNDVAGTGADGWLTGTLDNGVDPARPLYCAGGTNVAGSGRQTLFCIGQSPGDASNHFNVVMVSAS